MNVWGRLRGKARSKMGGFQSAGGAFISLGLGLGLSLAFFSASDAGISLPPGVACLSYAVSPGVSQCSSSTPAVTVRTELGSGEDASFENARRLLVRVVGPNAGGSLNTVGVVTQVPLSGGGLSQISLKDGVPTLTASETAASNLKQKDAVVIVDATSGVPGLSVDVSGSAPGQSAGNVVVVADSLQSLSVTANGYNGRPGEDPLVTLAKAALSGSPLVPPGIARDYVSRRLADKAGSLPLSFDQKDLNNYAANGLQCRSDEKAIGTAGSYGAGTLFDPGAPQGIEVTAFAQEEAKRSFCQRLPEFSAVQSCQAEAEYSFQAACSVVAEGRSVQFYKRSPVTWTRNICTTSAGAQVRKKIYRTAYIEINIPVITGGKAKSYAGQITREINFSDTYSVYRKNQLGLDSGGSPVYADPTQPQLYWYNPFWTQSYILPAGAALQVSPTATAANDFNQPSTYPTLAPNLKPGSSGTVQQGAKVTFVSRPATAFAAALTSGYGGAITGGETLYSFNDAAKNPRLSVSTGGNSIALAGGGTVNSYPVYGCAKVISLSPESQRWASPSRFTSPSAAKTTVDAAGNFDPAAYATYLEFFQSFDASVIGFSEQDLLNAGKYGTISVTNCFAYEAMDEVVAGQTAYGTWALQSSNSDLGPAGDGSGGTVASQSVCMAPFDQPIGTEVFLQYDDETACYVDDPRTPPAWLAAQKAASLGKDASSVTSGDFTISEMSSSKWTKNTSATVRAAITTVKGSAVATVSSTAGVAVGSLVGCSACGLPAATTVSGLSGTGVVILSQPAGESLSDFATFSPATSASPNLNAEFNFPPSVDSASSLSLTAQGQAAFCVPVGTATSERSPGVTSVETVLTTTAGSQTAELAVPTGILVGDSVSCTSCGVPYGTTILALSGNEVTMSQVATASAAKTTRFSSTNNICSRGATGNANTYYAESIASCSVPLTRSVAVPHYVLEQGSDVAIPDGSPPKQVCLSGIRLDKFLANVPRPSCPTGSSTKLRLSSFSSAPGEATWKTWEQKGGAPVDSAYSGRSSFVDTRYDDLPPQIFTAQTKDVYPSLTVAAASSFTGKAFPPDYGFTTALPSGVSSASVALTSQTPPYAFSLSTAGASAMRSGPGWLRQSSLVNRNSAYVTPNNFTPFYGPTLLDASNAWCNADAFVSVGSIIAKGFGAKGILRDVPKRVFGFTLASNLIDCSVSENTSSPSCPMAGGQVCPVGGTWPNCSQNITQRYVGIEVTGTDSSAGFYANPSIYRMAGGQTSGGTPDADAVSGYLSTEAFRSSNYPWLGARFTERCLPGQHYNQLTGFCHLPATPWQAAQRTVNRTLPDGQTKEPWAFLLTREKLLATPPLLDVAFEKATGGIPAHAGNTASSGNICRTTSTTPSSPSSPSSPAACVATAPGVGPSTDPEIIDVNALPNEGYLRLGFLRPMAAMTKEPAVSGQIFMNRPETLDQMVLGPGFASSRTGASSLPCTKGLTMIAVPVPASPQIDSSSSSSSSGGGGQTTSVPLDRDNYLSGTRDAAGNWWGPVFFMLTPVCDKNGVYSYKVAMRMMTLDAAGRPGVAPSATVTGGGVVMPEAVPLAGGGETPLRLVLGNGSFQQSGAQVAVWTLSNIYESLAAGMSATTGYESLTATEITSPKVRDRAAEWAAAGRGKSGLGWKTSIKTAPTPSTQDPNVQPLACSPATTAGGSWDALGVATNLTTVAGTAAATVQDNGKLRVSDTVSCVGCGVPAGTKVAGLSGKTGVTMSLAATKTGTTLATFAPSVPVTNGAVMSPAPSAAQDCTDALSSCAMTAEELSVFTLPLPNSKALSVTRAAATQFTPWSFELPDSAAKDPAYDPSSPFGQWTIISSNASATTSASAGGSVAPTTPAAPRRSAVPDCSIFNGAGQADDVFLPTASLADVPLYTTVVESLGDTAVMNPLSPTTPFMLLPGDGAASLRKSRACVQWDSVTGKTCNSFAPTIGGGGGSSLLFGGTWQRVYVDTRQRVSQDCRQFSPTQSGELSGVCQGGYLGAAESAAACTLGTPVYSLCKPCNTVMVGGSLNTADPAGSLCAPVMQPGAQAVTALCSPGSCIFPENSQSFQVEASVPVSGASGENGTNSGTATIFCRDCSAIDFASSFQAIPGTGGRGTNPIASSRSPTLTCVGWNQNPIAPIFSVRNLWSQPFLGGSGGQNGLPGQIGGSLNFYQDLTPEAVHQISDPNFWISPSPGQ